ncbi:HNH endonuclease [Corynebacterium sp. YIM 101645]|uniref:HNH endonuclease n=1 Tax=Corynebacterium lemuris TaxID=1859292 RepID=A0ABT2FYX1_9CORY|nr:HNH endonuclease signature motif containing protein [Corynebacterium lemuris]MCS5480449.1 HNH endonuclease [Corynebacterium lemuris]
MQPSWSVLNEADPHAVARTIHTAGNYRFWRAIQPAPEQLDTVDWTTLLAGLTRSTGIDATRITACLDALTTLDQLPMLKEVVEETWVLDIDHLRVIDRAATRAPVRLQDDLYFWEALDHALVERLLAPRRAHQLLPTPQTIRQVVATTITTVVTHDDHPAWPPVPEPDPPPEALEGDPEDNPGEGSNDASDDNGQDGAEETDAPTGPQPCLDPAELMRSLPPLGDTPAPGLWIDTEDNATLRFELSVDQATGTLIRDAVWQVAKAADVSQAKAMVMLILGQTTTSVTTHLYTVRDVAGAPVFHPLAGMLTAQAATRLLDISERTTDMDAAATAVTPAYTPTPVIRAYLVGRDWCCRWPGCSTPAVASDNDHRINHHDGGPTTPGNMVMLCRHHHNRKTDAQAQYLLDPVTGDVFWLFADGTWAVDHAQGPLAPVEKRWVQTYVQRRKRRAERAAARAAAQEFATYQEGAEARAEAHARLEEAVAQAETSNGPDPPEDTDPDRAPPDDQPTESDPPPF